jgi:hypothetical protein
LMGGEAARCFPVQQRTAIRGPPLWLHTPHPPPPMRPPPRPRPRPQVDAYAATLDNDEQRMGAEIIKKALFYPLRLIASNAGVNGSVVMNKVCKAQGRREGGGHPWPCDSRAWAFGCLRVRGWGGSGGTCGVAGV